MELEEFRALRRRYEAQMELRELKGRAHVEPQAVEQAFRSEASDRDVGELFQDGCARSVNGMAWTLPQHTASRSRHGPPEMKTAGGPFTVDPLKRVSDRGRVERSRGEGTPKSFPEQIEQETQRVEPRGKGPVCFKCKEARHLAMNCSESIVKDGNGQARTSLSARLRIEPRGRERSKGMVKARNGQVRTPLLARLSGKAHRAVGVQSRGGKNGEFTVLVEVLLKKQTVGGKSIKAKMHVFKVDDNVITLGTNVHPGLGYRLVHEGNACALATQLQAEPQRREREEPTSSKKKKKNQRTKNACMAGIGHRRPKC
ncbi:unnamed protein product [Heligmosomoides polygyrus]|uniref:CCHC-type domain-containing protein n=1 Tax=Heligmosomoides polygyrus TaxID=6339 RepID=A0A183GHR4_HELPZ|nr:unnamed protein product [Heligmosomoides polygyrus]